MIYDVLICFPSGRPNGNVLRIEADSHDEAARKRAESIVGGSAGVNSRVDGNPMLVIGMENMKANKFKIDGVQVPLLRWYTLRGHEDGFEAEFRSDDYLREGGTV